MLLCVQHHRDLLPTGMQFYNTLLSHTDIDDCTVDLDNCDDNTTCTNTIGNFMCTCNVSLLEMYPIQNTCSLQAKSKPQCKYTADVRRKGIIDSRGDIEH